MGYKIIPILTGSYLFVISLKYVRYPLSFIIFMFVLMISLTIWAALTDGKKPGEK